MREQDGRGVGGYGVYLYPQMHQEYTFRQKCMQNTSLEWTGIPDQWNRIYRPTQNSIA